ncbi:hypothetical protein RUND412_007658 [Rhizina undulata]
MLRTYPENSTPEETGYVKYRLPIDPSLQFDAGSTKVDALEYDQAVAIAKLLEERNINTAADGEWVLSGLRMAVGSEKFELFINFRRYRDHFVDSQGMDFARTTVENKHDDSAEVSEEIAVTALENVQAEFSRNFIQQPDPFYSEISLAREVVGNAPMETANFSEETAINTTEEAETEISRILSPPDPFDSELDSTVGSGASTPVPSIIRTEKEIQIDELDRIEDVASILLESLGGSITLISMLKGVWEARKILIGEEHVRTFKTMGNLGHWYRQYGWKVEGMALLQMTVDGLKRVLGERNEDTLYAMYKLAEAKSSSHVSEAWWLFKKVLEGQVEVLGENDPATLDTMKQLEILSADYYCLVFNDFDEGLKFLESLVKFPIQIRGEYHPLTVVAMHLLVNHHARCSKEIETHACLKSMVIRRISVLAEKGGNIEAQYVFGEIDIKTPISDLFKPFHNA